MKCSRRAFLGAAGATAATGVLPASQGAELPLRSTGLEHLGMWVRDVAASGAFYGRLFNPLLHKEKEDPLRYYVPLGVGYLALGAAGERTPQVDHYCALVEGYDPKAMAELLQAKGLPPGRFGMIGDPDGIRLQLLGTPGGLAKSTEPAGRIAPEDPLVQPIALDSVLLDVSDLARALPFYRLFFGAEKTSSGDATVWFQIAKTRLGVRQAGAGETPMVNRFRVSVAKFDAGAVESGLKKVGAMDVIVDRGARLVRFRDPDGISVEIQS
jgi:catechol 2,3-dioxygenase-like lactoylglutathione lyase family enzyme